MKNRFFIVKTKCGHVGRNFYIPISFPIKARSKTEAASIARQIPRVKHDHKDAIISVEEVDQITYENQQESNDNDPYLTVHTKCEQDKIMPLISYRLIEDPHYNKVEIRNKRSSAQYRLRKSTAIINQKRLEIQEWR